MPVTLACEYCGKEFTTINRRKRWQRYCSRRCVSEAWRGPHPELYELADKICPQCGNRFHPSGHTKRFCSRACATSWHGNPEQRGQGPTRVVPCAACGTEFARRSRKNKYCSHECYARSNRGEANWNFNSYMTQDKRGYWYYTTAHPEHAGKTYHSVLWHAHNPGARCPDCGGPAEHVHHLDGDPTNNDLANLLGMCNPCHRRRHAREERFWRYRRNLKR